MTILDGTLSGRPSEAKRVRMHDALFALAIGAVTLFRLYYCTLVPGTTGDLPRHIFYGLYVNRDGLSAAGKPLVALSHYLEPVSWSGLPYSYPIVALHFFQAIALVSPTMFFAKLALTTLDGASAVMIQKYSGQRWLSLLFWAAPMSLWWVSREGQFEPLQSFLLIAAIYALKEQAGLAFALLGLAIQTKLTAAVMLPWFLIELWRIESTRRWQRSSQ
ncbi:MAG TPA: glycosyltransferase 87 family protein, partial [Polyangiales bacterium]